MTPLENIVLNMFALFGALMLGRIAYNVISCLRGNHKWLYWDRPTSHYCAHDPSCWILYRRCDYCGVTMFKYSDKDGNYKDKWNVQAGYITFREGKDETDKSLPTAKAAKKPK
jgi:hypothetical protein